MPWTTFLAASPRRRDPRFRSSGPPRTREAPTARSRVSLGSDDGTTLPVHEQLVAGDATHILAAGMRLLHLALDLLGQCTARLAFCAAVCQVGIPLDRQTAAGRAHDPGSIAEMPGWTKKSGTFRRGGLTNHAAIIQDSVRHEQWSLARPTGTRPGFLCDGVTSDLL